MRVSLGWLKEDVDISMSTGELCQKLTMAGLEVGRVEVMGGEWDNMVVGRVVSISPHPNADRLKLVTVDLGTEKSTVVCGAPNIRVGDKVAFAKVGALLIDGHSTEQRIRLKPAKIRGVVSEGMICSERELGISDEHEGIMVCPPKRPSVPHCLNI